MAEISIIICTYNRSELLEDTLSTLNKVARGLNIEVIVVDNGSTDNTEQVVQSWIESSGNSSLTTLYLFEGRQGVSYARNTGVVNAQGRIIIFLDDDAIPSEHWIKSIYEAFAKYPDAVALGGKILPKFGTKKPDWLTKNFEIYFSIMDLGDNEQEYQVNQFPMGVNMAFRKEVFHTFNFCTDLGRKGMSLLSGEETAIFRKIVQQGKIYYIPGMCVTHFIPKERLTKRWLLSRIYAEGVSDVRQNRTTISSVDVLRKLWFYIRRKIRMALDSKYRKDFEKQIKFAYEKGCIDELLSRSSI